MQREEFGINGSFELIRQKEDIAEEEIINAVNERSQYYKASAYYSEIIDYWEDVREIRDISNVIEPLFETDKRYFI